MKVLDLAVVCELVPDVVLLSFLVHVGHKQNPAFDRCTTSLNTVTTTTRLV